MNLKSQPYTSASVVPVSRDSAGVLHFVLGLEQYAARNRRWCEFGGRKKSSDADCFETAAREMCEECCHTLRIVDLPVLTVDTLARFLRRGEYVCALVVERMSKGQRVVFLVQTEFDPGLNQRFQTLRCAMSDVVRQQRAEHELGQWVNWWLPGVMLNPDTGYIRVLPDYYEKSSIQMFTQRDMQHVVDTNGILFRRTSNAFYFRQDFVPLLRILLPLMNAPTVPARVVTGTTLVIPWNTQTTVSHT